ncbi:uncharacterized protein [Sinocyclocheilus grahami]|uniref:uncharacterized protein isoform X1 n=1 Tax=Sinocyclocheilus grahami TaxID=75366 RepID=UPI0007AD4F38|nr:PREDICTED: uncharacterized protein LOC107564420 isoform X1 [Sinocyclocheilus grahami]XP_016104999.1 PREDICTED: uncharacterized protein LOC107564420 isoform X2 [Sinocyclocheilus grahami]
MRTYCVLPHIFAALLLCDYGMFSMPSPSPSGMPTNAISNISDSNTTVTTAKSVTVGNDSSTLESGLGRNQSNDLNGMAESSRDDSDTESESVNGSTSRVISSTARPESTTSNVKHHTTQQKKDSASDTGAIIILIIILILIGFLLGILYCLRKKGRSYSFDLTRGDVVANDYVDTPLRSNQQGISYEQTNKDLPVCLDYVQEDKSEEKTNPKENGSAGEKTEQTPTNENDYQNVPEENSFSSNSSLAAPMKNEEFNLYLNLLGGESDLNDSTEAEATDTAQNENNNNVSNAGWRIAEEIFTEISLDEPKEHS